MCICEVGRLSLPCAKGLGAYFLHVVFAASAPLDAAPFELFQPDVEKGAIEAEVLTGTQTGLPQDEGARLGIEAGIGYGVTSFWKAKPIIEFEREVGGHLKATSLGVENVFALWTPENERLHIGWFTLGEFAITEDETNAVVFGPIIRWRQGPLALILNPFLEKTFGQNRELGIAFTYGWMAAFDVRDGLEVGVQGFGAIEDVVNGPGLDEQTHQIGPVVMLGHDIGNGKDVEVTVGALFGITESTPDVAYQFNFAMGF